MAIIHLVSRRQSESAPVSKKGKIMLWTIFVVLGVIWLLGFSFSVGGGLIHLLLVAALVLLGFNLLSGRRIA